MSRVLLLGGTGTAGRAAAWALHEAGYDIACLVRRRGPAIAAELGLPENAKLIGGEVTDPAAHAAAQDQGPFDAVLSCLASRTGAPADAWAIDHGAHRLALDAALAAGVPRFVLLSAICVQKPRLAFQHAKLAFEAELVRSGISYSIVRPTAFFKSLSGQVARVRDGKPFLLFGDGRLTACKPISDADLGRYFVATLEDPALSNRVLPIGGPGPAITPRDQGEYLFAQLGRAPKFRSVPPAMLSVVAAGLGLVGRFSLRLSDKAEFARTGQYYATESMLVWDPGRGRYDADATPEFGSETLFDHYDRLLSGEAVTELGAHAVF